MMNSIKSLCLLSYFLLFTLFSSYGQTPLNQSLSYTEFLQQCIEFKKRPLAERQEVWVFHFWASWSGPSQSQIADLKILLEDYKDKPVRMISISTDKLSSNWIAALRRHNMAWEQVNVSREADYSHLKTAFRHNSQPALFVLDPDGFVRRLPEVKDVRSFLEAVVPRLPEIPYYAFPQSQPDPPTKPDPKPNQSTDQSEWVTHTVKSGDTLFSIYRQYGVAVADIKKQNGLVDNTIKLGQVLKIKLK